MDESEVKIPEGRYIEIVTDRAQLIKPTEPFDFADPQMDPLQLGADLVKNMVDRNGLGLSANQIGYPYSVFTMRTAPKMTVAFNPKIVGVDDEEDLLEEGCLSFPNLIIKIKRYKTIRVRFWYPNGEFKLETFTGMTARVFQHELDHLNGIVFDQRASLFHKNQAERQMAKRLRRQKNVQPVTLDPALEKAREQLSAVA